MSEHRTCTKCGETKPILEFALKGARKPNHDPRRHDCRACVRVYMKARVQLVPALPDTSLPGESWLPVVGYEDRYEVSDLGRLRRTKRGPNTRIGFVKIATLKKQTGYLCYGLNDANGRAVQELAHILVARAFLGPPPTPQHEVNHKDGVKINNTPANLEWVTAQENIQHSHRLGLAGRWKNR